MDSSQLAPGVMDACAFLHYYLDYWDVIHLDLIDFSVDLDEREAGSQCVLESSSTVDE